MTVDGLFTSLRFDPDLVNVAENTEIAGHASPYSLLPFHRDRLVVAANAFGWHESANMLAGESGYERFVDMIQSHKRLWDSQNDPRQPVKVRPVLRQDGTMDVTFTPEQPRDVHAMFTNAQLSPDKLSELYETATPVDVHIDSQATVPSDLTRYKTTSRDHYLDARERVGLGRNYAAKDDVALWNPQGQITETSISNVALWREDRWITPSHECGGLHGVMKRWLIERGYWTEGFIAKEDVNKGEWVLLSNGLKGCYPAKIA